MKKRILAYVLCTTLFEIYTQIPAVAKTDPEIPYIKETRDIEIWQDLNRLCLIFNNALGEFKLEYTTNYLSKTCSEELEEDSNTITEHPIKILRSIAANRNLTEERQELHKALMTKWYGKESAASGRFKFFKDKYNKLDKKQQEKGILKHYHPEPHKNMEYVFCDEEPDAPLIKYFPPEAEAPQVNELNDYDPYIAQNNVYGTAMLLAEFDFSNNSYIDGTLIDPNVDTFHMFIFDHLHPEYILDGIYIETSEDLESMKVLLPPVLHNDFFTLETSYKISNNEKETKKYMPTREFTKNNFKKYPTILHTIDRCSNDIDIDPLLFLRIDPYNITLPNQFPPLYNENWLPDNSYYIDNTLPLYSEENN